MNVYLSMHTGRWAQWLPPIRFKDAFSYRHQSLSQHSCYNICRLHIYKYKNYISSYITSQTYSWRLHHYHWLYLVFNPPTLNLKQPGRRKRSCIFLTDWQSVKRELGSGPVSTSGWKEARFWWIHYVPEPNRPTHPHGWRDAPRAGLAVTKPEGAVVPGNRRVELQLMPLFLGGRRIRRTFIGLVHSWCCCVRAVSGGCACLLSCLTPHRW